MWGLFCTLLLLATGTYSDKVGISFIPHGIPPAREPQIRTSPQMYTITQRIDHFNPADNRTWEMRYMQNDAFYQEGGPMFVFIGGEWVITPGWITSGLFFDLARLHNANLFYTEHRFYGGSYPIYNLKTESLKYLSADQALADLMYFIQYQKQNIPALRKSTVVVAGSSYSAALATWARLKYPHIVDIAYASSAPVHAKADFTEYFEVVEESFGRASPTCPQLIRSAFAEIMESLKTPEGSAKVKQLFNFCWAVNGTAEPDRSYALSELASPLASVVQTAQPGTLETTCRLIENQTGSDMEKLARYVAKQVSCIADYEFFVNYYSGTQVIGPVILRQWLYQTCTEFGWYQTQPFGDTFSIDLYYSICRDIFGEEFSPSTLHAGIKRTNLFYGGIKPKITRLVSCHGTGDPWHTMGLQKDLNDKAITIIVNGTSHSADLYSISDSDSEELKQAKTRIMNTITAWIKEIEEGRESTTAAPIPTTTQTPITTTTQTPITTTKGIPVTTTTEIPVATTTQTPITTTKEIPVTTTKEIPVTTTTEIPVVTTTQTPITTTKEIPVTTTTEIPVTTTTEIPVATTTQTPITTTKEIPVTTTTEIPVTTTKEITVATTTEIPIISTEIPTTTN